jgi:hypothetical protein
MKRRAFVEKLGVGSAALVSLSAMGSAQDQGHEHKPVSGPLASATVSFGQWPNDDQPLNRFPNSSPAARNSHRLVPHEVTIKAGGAVNFVIAGLHNVQVYGDGTQPGDVNANLTTPTTGTPAGVPIINDPTNRLYLGLDPSLFPRDRVEVVHFADPGTYLVICGIQPHFVNDHMFGFVTVLP